MTITIALSIADRLALYAILQSRTASTLDALADAWEKLELDKCAELLKGGASVDLGTLPQTRTKYTLTQAEFRLVIGALCAPAALPVALARVAIKAFDRLRVQ